MVLPTFIIGGAPRSGTIFLCYALDRHPDIYMAKPYIPEPKVFMIPQPNPAAYYARYATLFAGRSRQRTLGEKTSYYLESVQACQLIYEMLPAVRLLFIVREPVARAYSNYLWSRKNGLETLSFEEAIEREGQRSSPLPPEKAYARPFDYLSRGNYATFARRYYNLFGREKVAFFLYEDLLQQPELLLNNIQTFIGVDPLPFHQLDVGIVNSARDMGHSLNSDTATRLKRHMLPQVEDFAALTGLDLSVWEY
ncbi:MAG: sulfotransferase [Chloroflexota bacterium]